MEPEVPRLQLRDSDAALRLVHTVMDWARRHPDATRTLVHSLVAEGRRFAATPDGRSWVETLRDSESVRRGRILWQVCGLDAFVGGQPGLVPSDWLRLVAATLESADVEALLSSLAGAR